MPSASAVPRRCHGTLVAALAIATLITPVASAESETVASSVEIIDWGIIERAPVVGSAPSDTLLGQNRLIDPNVDVEIAERTLDIPACPGLRFGMLFRTTTLATRNIQVAVIVHHPEQVAPDGRRSTISRWTAEAMPRNRFTGWRFDQPFEMVPGQWTFSLTIGSRTVAEKTFIVRRDPCALTS